MEHTYCAQGTDVGYESYGLMNTETRLVLSVMLLLHGPEGHDPHQIADGY
jgi:hypothetical protein